MKENSISDFLITFFGNNFILGKEIHLHILLFRNRNLKETTVAD